MTLKPEQKFEAALARFQDHTELLRALTSIDLQVLGGCVTLQFAVAAWVADHPPTHAVGRWGLLFMAFVVTSLATKLLYNNYRRRKEVVDSLGRTKAFLQFGERGAYLPENPLDADAIFRPWWWWYMIAVWSAFASIGFVIFSDAFRLVASK